MKKTIFSSSIIALIFVLCFFNSYSQSSVSPYFEMRPHSEDDEQAADMTSITPMTAEQNQLHSENDLNPENNFEMYEGAIAGAGVEAEINKTNSVYNIPLAYGFSTRFLKKENVKERFSLSGVFPLVRKSFETKMYNEDTQQLELYEFNTTGFGDIQLKTRYSLKKDKNYVSAAVSVKLPTGKTENILEDKIIIPLGSGSTDIGLSLFGRKPFGNFSAYTGMVYNILGSYEWENFDYNYGNQFMWLASLTYLKYKRIYGGMKLRFFASGNTVTKTTFNNQTNEFESPGVRLLDVSPFVKFRLPHHIILSASVGIPVLTRFKEVNYEVKNPSRSLRFGVGLKFRIFSFDLI